MTIPKAFRTELAGREDITRLMGRWPIRLPVRTWWKRLHWYLQLTKPTTMLLVLMSGATALTLEGSMLAQPLRFAAFLGGLYLAGGSACALNQYLERDIDGAMIRTRSRRPLPLGRLGSPAALVFALTIGVLGLIVLGAAFNLLTAGLALGNIFFYVVVYTILLKPRTPYNIVIGGVAGAIVPVGAWAAATDSTAMVPWILFAIIFLWTPPHFWALALCRRDDYQRTGQPMMPVVKSMEAVLDQILFYSLALFGASLAYVPAAGGRLYLIVAGLLGSIFVYISWSARRRRDERSIGRVFAYSIFYLFALLATMIIDKLTAGPKG